MMNVKLFAVALTLGAIPVRAQTPVKPTLGWPVPDAASAKVPATVRRTLPRSANTLFFVRTDFGRQTAFLHGWNARSGATTIDVLAPSSSKRRAMRRLSRKTVPRIESSGGVRVRAALLNAKEKRGIAVFLNWLEPNVGLASQPLPRGALVWPKGWSGPVYTRDLSTESSPSGNVYYRFRRASDGRLALLLIEETFEGENANTQTETRFSWNPAKNAFQAVGEPERRRLEENGWQKD